MKLLRKMTENDMKMWKRKRTPSVVQPQYLSFYLAKIQNQGQFWNPQNRQISKLTLLFKFGGDLMEILLKNKLSSFFVDTLYNFAKTFLMFQICYFVLTERGNKEWGNHIIAFVEFLANFQQMMDFLFHPWKSSFCLV